MTDAQRIELRAAEARRELRALALDDNATGDAIQTATAKLNDLETRAAVLTATEDASSSPAIETDTTGEGAEFRSLEKRAKVSDFVGAAVEQRRVDGVAAEYLGALKMDEGTFPLPLLAPETRATTDADTAATASMWVDRLFAGMASSRVGVTRRSVAPGVATVPVMGGTLAGAARSRSQKIADASWSVATTEIKPKRFGARAVFSTEDADRIPGLNAALRRDMRMAVTEGLDRLVFTGDSSPTTNTDDIKGLAQLTASSDSIVELELTQAEKIVGKTVLARLVGLLDGKGASMLSDLGIVGSVGFAKAVEGEFVSATIAEYLTIGSFLRNAGVSWQVRGEIADTSGNGDLGAFIGKMRNIQGAAVHAIWAAGDLIVDRVTRAAEGETALTLSVRHGLAFPRPSSFAKLTFKT